MSIIRRENEWLKETIIGEETKRRLKNNNQYRWTFVECLHKPKNSLEKTLK
jgi:hypothetical protein